MPGCEVSKAGESACIVTMSLLFTVAIVSVVASAGCAATHNVKGRKSAQTTILMSHGDPPGTILMLPLFRGFAPPTIVSPVCGGVNGGSLVEARGFAPGPH